MKSLNDKRLIINGVVNGKEYPFLVDTGATIALMDESKIKKLDLIKGKRFSGTIIGQGGEVEEAYYCNTFVDFGGKNKVGLFVLTDISSVKRSIEHETGMEILGIMSLPQMKFLGIVIDTLNNEIIIPK